MASELLPEDNVEYYNSIDELLAEEDIVETDVKIIGWKGKLRIRALTFGQMEKINQQATAKKDDDTKGIKAGELDSTEFVFWTLVEGVVRPKMNITMARKFIDNNGTFVKELSDEIWNIGRLSKRLFDAYVQETKRAAAVQRGDIKDAQTIEETTDY